jgi:hypothetical protein
VALPQTPDSNPIDYIDDEDFIALEISNDMAGERLDKVLATFLPDYSRNRLKTWVEAGAVTVDGKVTKARYLLHGGESIKVFPAPVGAMPRVLPCCSSAATLFSTNSCCLLRSIMAASII